MKTLLKSRMTIAVFLSCLLFGFAPNIYSQILMEKEMPDTTYTVKWTLVEVLPAPCPDAHKEDEYGVKNNYMTSCAVLHLRTETTEKQKEFNTEIEADEFIKNMPLKKNMGMAIGSFCKDPIKIKNIKQKQGANSK